MPITSSHLIATFCAVIALLSLAVLQVMALARHHLHRPPGVGVHRRQLLQDAGRDSDAGVLRIATGCERRREGLVSPDAEFLALLRLCAGLEEVE